MTTCGASRLAVPAFLVGFAVASVTGVDLYGWLAAGVTLTALALTRAVRGGGGSCTVGWAGAPDATVVRGRAERRSAPGVAGPAAEPDGTCTTGCTPAAEDERPWTPTS